MIKPRSECNFPCIVFVLLWPIFFASFLAHFWVPRVQYLDQKKVGVERTYGPCCIVVKLGDVKSMMF
jgi:hypothetical protein